MPCRMTAQGHAISWPAQALVQEKDRQGIGLSVGGVEWSMVYLKIRTDISRFSSG